MMMMIWALGHVDHKSHFAPITMSAPVVVTVGIGKNDLRRRNNGYCVVGVTRAAISVTVGRL